MTERDWFPFEKAFTITSSLDRSIKSLFISKIMVLLHGPDRKCTSFTYIRNIGTGSPLTKSILHVFISSGVTLARTDNVALAQVLIKI